MLTHHSFYQKKNKIIISPVVDFHDVAADAPSAFAVAYDVVAISRK